MAYRECRCNRYWQFLQFVLLNSNYVWDTKEEPLVYYNGRSLQTAFYLFLYRNITRSLVTKDFWLLKKLLFATRIRKEKPCKVTSSVSFGSGWQTSYPNPHPLRLVIQFNKTTRLYPKYFPSVELEISQRGVHRFEVNSNRQFLPPSRNLVLGIICGNRLRSSDMYNTDQRDTQTQ